MEKQINPESLHMSIMPQHCGIVDKLIESMVTCLDELQKNPSKYQEKSKAMYGMVAKIPD